MSCRATVQEVSNMASLDSLPLNQVDGDIDMLDCFSTAADNEYIANNIGAHDYDFCASMPSTRPSEATCLRATMAAAPGQQSELWLMHSKSYENPCYETKAVDAVSLALLPTPRTLPSVTSHDALCSSHSNPLFDLHGRGSLLAAEEDYDDVSRRYQAREQPSLPPFWHQEQQLHQQDGSSSFLSLSSSSTSEDAEYLRAAPELRCTAKLNAARPPALLVPEMEAECASADYGTTGSLGTDTSGDQAGWQPEEDSWTAGVREEAMQVSHCLVQSSCWAAGSDEREVEEAVWTPGLGAEANQVAGAMALETSLGAHSAAASNASADMDVDFDALEKEAADVVSGWQMASMWFLSAVAALASADRAGEGVMAGLRRRFAAVMAWRGAESTPAQPVEAPAEVACCTPPPPPRAATAACNEAASGKEGGDEDCGTAWGSPASSRCTSRCNSGARRSPSEWSAFCSRNGRADWAEHWEGWDEDVQADGEEKKEEAMVARGKVSDCTKLDAGRTSLQWCDAVHGCGLGKARLSALLESLFVAASG